MYKGEKERLWVQCERASWWRGLAGAGEDGERRLRSACSYPQGEDRIQSDRRTKCFSVRGWGRCPGQS